MSSQSPSTRPLGIVPLALVVVLVVSTLAPALLPDISRLVTVSNIKPVSGASFFGTLGDSSLSDDKVPTGAELYLIETKRGTALHRLDDWCVGVKFACARLNALVDSNFRSATYEVKRQLGPGGSVHQDIVEKGDGRFSVWGGGVYFSLPGSLAISNVTRLELRTPIVSPLWVARIFSALRYLSAIGLVAWIVVRLFGLRLGFLYRNVLPGLVISVVLLGASLYGADWYFRYAGQFPITDNKWPTEFVDQVGFLFKPGDTVRLTNGTEFWASEQVNSLGFIDREPVLPKPPGTFRIVLVGDSFVEAAQVAIEQKLQSLLAEDLNRRFPDRKFDAVALGFSGTGQANQLPFYERSRNLKPDLVILVFVSNDFANNSHVLESMHYGWHPDHLPRVFMREQRGQPCGRLPIDSAWRKSLLFGDLAERIRQMRAISPELDSDLRDMNSKVDLIEIFRGPGPLLPVLEAAVASTKCAFVEWQKLAEQDGFKLLVASADSVDGQLARLKRITDELELPLIDLRKEFARHHDLALARFKTDFHWSPHGHRWAADAIANYLTENGYFEAGKQRR
jgi:hypothetical protein